MFFHDPSILVLLHKLVLPSFSINQRTGTYQKYRQSDEWSIKNKKLLAFADIFDLLVKQKIPYSL